MTRKDEILLQLKRLLQSRKANVHPLLHTSTSSSEYSLSTVSVIEVSFTLIILSLCIGTTTIKSLRLASPPQPKMLLLILVLTGLVATFSTGFIIVDIQREEVPVDLVQHDRHHLGQRQIAQTLDNLRSLYFANITLGTPLQKLRMHIDTGSSDLWCNSPESILCASRYKKCAISGTYASSASSTYELVNNNFSISYQDGTGARGDYVTDTLGIGGMTIADFQFGVGIRSSSTEGILGIGYPINEAQVRRSGGNPYDNLPQRMAKDGLIKSNAYSEFDLLVRELARCSD